MKWRAMYNNHNNNHFYLRQGIQEWTKQNLWKTWSILEYFVPFVVLLKILFYPFKELVLLVILL